MPDFICLGGLRIDYLITADGRAASDIFGGNATFAAVGARLWSGPNRVGILAKSGPGFPAEWLGRLGGHGIDTGCVIPVDEAVDQRTFFSHFADGSRDEGNPASHYRALGLPLPAGLAGYAQASADAQEASYHPLRIDGAGVDKSCWPRRAFHCSPIDWETTRSCIAAARRGGTPQITLDPGLWIGQHSLAEMGEVLGLCDAFLPSEAEARLLCGPEMSRQAMARHLAAAGPPIVILKLGSEGSLVYQREADRFTPIPAAPARVLDVTGAGDAFCGAFAVGLSETGDPVTAARWGAVAASFVIEGFGALHALEKATDDERDTRLKSLGSSMAQSPVPSPQFLVPQSRRNPMPTPIILDVDTGYDDAVAILMAAGHPALDLLGVTTVAGNAPLSVTTDNTLRTLDAAGYTNIPVIAGAHRPLLRELGGSTDAQSQHFRFPKQREATPGYAADWLVETLMASDGETVLIPLAPLTNIALALHKEPRIVEKVKKVVLMGGALHGGNMTPNAEFNVWIDPEAARIVWQADWEIVMVGLDVTGRALIPPEDVARVKALTSERARITGELLDFCVQREVVGWGRPGVQIFDACAVAAVIDPGMLTTCHCFVDVETTGTLTAGMTVCDVDRLTDNPPNCYVGLDIDYARFFRVMLEGLGG
ncbi:MAG: nucleoside hydrolase [Caldilineaceae bacterium]|nr:nucleoside hydrolase [Caldilineaceae bacterium]